MLKTALSPLATSTLATQVQLRLEHAIFTGELKPGERLVELDQEAALDEAPRTRVLSDLCAAGGS